MLNKPEENTSQENGCHLDIVSKKPLYAKIRSDPEKQRPPTRCSESDFRASKGWGQGIERQREADVFRPRARCNQLEEALNNAFSSPPKQANTASGDDSPPGWAQLQSQKVSSFGGHSSEKKQSNFFLGNSQREPADWSVLTKEEACIDYPNKNAIYTQSHPRHRSHLQLTIQWI
jgi:hypothetical protein